MAVSINGPGVALGEQAASQMQAPDIPLDRDGRGFDPSLHIVDSGKPKIDKSGFLVKRRLRKAADGETTATAGTVPSASASGGAGVAASQITFALAMMWGGPDWQPRPEEVQPMTEAWAGVMERYGVTEVHPVVTLVCVMAAYAQPRLSKPETVSRLRAFWHRLRHRRSAYATGGYNGVRQDNAGNPNVNGVQQEGPEGSDS